MFNSVAWKNGIRNHVLGGDNKFRAYNNRQYYIHLAQKHQVRKALVYPNFKFYSWEILLFHTLCLLPISFFWNSVLRAEMWLSNSHGAAQRLQRMELRLLKLLISKTNFKIWAPNLFRLVSVSKVPSKSPSNLVSSVLVNSLGCGT